MTNEPNDEEMDRLNQLVDVLPATDRGSADYSAGYLVGYRIGMQNAFVVAYLHNDAEAIATIREEYLSRIGAIHVALLQMAHGAETDRALIAKYGEELGLIAGARMWEVDIVEGAYPQVQSVVIEGNEERADPRDEWDPIGGDAA